MNILLTGATGFLGGKLLKGLEKHNTTALLRSENKYFSPSVVVSKFNRDSDFSAAVKDKNTIIHCAAVAHNKSNDSDYINEVNVAGTINLAQQAVKAGVKRFVFISSIGVLGNSTTKNEKSWTPKPF